MTSTQIINGSNVSARPKMLTLGSGGAGQSVIVEGHPSNIVVTNSGAGRATSVQVDPDDAPVGAVAELGVGQSLNIAQGVRYRISALSGCVLQLAWS